MALLAKARIAISAEQRGALDELVKLGFDEASAFKWYLQLDDSKERINLMNVAKLLGKNYYEEGWLVIHGLFAYLDPQEKDREKSRAYARAFAKRVAQKRAEANTA